MEPTIIITPLVTLAGVWLGARYTLRNEIIKKSIELRAGRIEQLAAECEECLTGLINHVGMLASMLDSEFTIVRTLNSPRKGVVAVGELNELATRLEGSPWKLDADRLSQCRQKLAFHRSDDLYLWAGTVGKALKDINQFFMVTMPGEQVRDMRSVERTEEEALAFARQLRLYVREIDSLRNTLSDSLAGEYHQLTRPAEPATLRRCFRSAVNRLRHFFS